MAVECVMAAECVMAVQCVIVNRYVFYTQAVLVNCLGVFLLWDLVLNMYYGVLKRLKWSQKEYFGKPDHMIFGASGPE